jgi:arylsulfatase A-like enzyme
LPTIAGLAGVTQDLPKGIEGGSLVPVLTNPAAGTVQRPREEFVVHFPHYDKDPIGPASAIYLGSLKLIRVYETGQLRLFDISKDPGERHDLAAQMPDKVGDLNQRLTDYLTAVNAQIPKPNPGYDPSKPTEMRRGGKRKGKS